MTKIKPPIELIVEIANSLPLNIRWAKLRVSLVFDLSILAVQRDWIFNVLENGITQLGLVDTHLDQRGYPNLDDHEDQLMVINAQLDYIFGEAFTVSLSSVGLRKEMNVFLARWDKITIEESDTLDEVNFYLLTILGQVSGQGFKNGQLYC
uniref:F-box domain-containing protein n=1 Tax=Meloidogyne floridensis TaxID=298350 RepID=A0A915P6X5_9BILA